MLTFEQPFLLLLLLPVGALVYLTWRRMSLPFSAPQRRLILACRLALFTLVIAALAGASWSQPISRQTTIFVGDISSSTAGQRTFIEQWINSAIQHKRPDDQVGIIATGSNALVEQSVQSHVDFSHFESTPDTNYTDLAAGLRLASAIMPSDSMRHVVLLTDGQQNLEDAMQEAQLLQQQGIRLDIVPLPAAKNVEARINDISAPTEVRTNERFVLHVKLYTNVAQTSTLRVYLDQKLISQQKVTLAVGEQEVSINLLAPPPGFHTYRVTLEAGADTIAQNNEAATYVNVQGPPRVLVVEGKPGSGQNIIAALKATKIDVTVGTPNDVPTTLDGLAPYSAVILADVPALALGNTRMATLQAYVRDLGRGLVVSGGENSYSLGGYTNTPLEQTLPVSMDVPQHKDTPSIAVVLIVESLESDITVNISKEAAKGVVNLLTPRDQVGISSAYGSLTIPMQYVKDKASIDKQIDSMNPDDPGSYNPDLSNAEQVLLHTNAKIKHVILLGDGDAFDNYAPQVMKMAKENITVSTVETNAASVDELNTMINIANWGRGRFYRADDPSSIPQVLLKETERAARRTVINESFVPAVVTQHPVLTGLNTLPDLNGYVATTPKPNAQMVLVSHRDDPVLAVWQYGLGRVVAWTSDALGLWTGHWLQWKEDAHWWANLVTWTLPSPDSALNINSKVINGRGHLTVDLPANTAANAGNKQQVQARIVPPNYLDNPGASNQTVNLQPTAPQRWEGDFPVPQPGAYLIQVTWKDQKGSGQLQATTGMIVPYSPEFKTVGTDTQFLKRLAQAGGGSLLNPNDIAAAFSQNLMPVTAALPITFLLLALAALLLPIDIATRRLSNLEFLTLGYRWLMGLLNPAAKTIATSAGQLTEGALGTSLGTLRTQRKARRGEALRQMRQVSKEPPRTGTSSVKETRETPPATPVATSTATETKSDVSVAEQLLEAKRKRGSKKSSS
ncbi:VWA domain-containing protein [Reticulibacter mediterranei]|uniref:VWA domain-containing protein n=1 Tax=Reticulibacter mediterranei TaxID=2778369 RepID=A0A8J3N2I8_9CHLR|nr:glutamine amidotransferase [Reticulibacter mediterranei]GHO95632.1 VWA domain-containing protein [Reticulibacter mediterranei]